MTSTNKARPLGRRIIRVAAIVLAGLLAVVLASALTNAALTASERATIAPYGQTITIGGGAVNVYRNGGTGPTLVMLSGFGTAAPTVDFAPLIRELDAFDVIVIEGFGYGYSDHDVANRTIGNITGEIHEVLGQLGVTRPVIMLGHSMGGLYTRYYANAYPRAVSAIIGIDPMSATTTTDQVGTPSITERTLAALGVVRWATMIDPKLVRPTGSAFTGDDLRHIAVMTNWNYGNLSISDEWSRLAANSTAAAAKPIPADIPVLEFLSTDSVATIPGWLEHHQAELSAVTTHDLEIVEGAHYLHWTQAPLLAQKITQFVATNVAS